jgi:hypothetical protein
VSRDPLRCEVVEITPEIAAQWLALNRLNRPLRPGRVAEIATMMAAHQWEITGEAIKFGTDGLLLDGQHRLAAVIASGITIRSLVIWEVDTAARMFMDSGKARTLGDIVTMEGIEGGPELVGVARASLALRIGIVTGSLPRYVTRKSIAEMVIKHRQALHVAARRGENIRDQVGAVGRAVFSAVVYDVARIHGDDVAGEFVTGVAYGGGGVPTPYVVLRSWLVKSTVNNKKRTINEVGDVCTTALEEAMAGTGGERRYFKAVPPYRYLTDDLSDLP